MRNFFKFFIVSTLFSLSNDALADEIIFETYASECGGECRSTLKLNDLKKEVCFHNIQKSNPRCMTMPWKQMGDFQSLLNLIPKAFFDLPAKVGDPDAYDQGGINLEITRIGKSHKSNIDPDKIPPTLKSLIEKLRKIKSEFH